MKKSLAVALLLIALMRLPAAESKPISVTVGDESKITLQYNSGTGYQWQFPKPIDEKHLKLVWHRGDGRSNPQKCPGSAGDETWTLRRSRKEKPESNSE